MKKIQSLLAIAVVLFTTMGCEKVLEVDIDSAQSRVVIEAEIYDGPGPFLVQISKSVGIDESSNFPAVQGAFVTISDGAGSVDTLLEAQPGKYYTQNLVGASGTNYSLKVEHGDETFEAECRMPNLVPIDRVTTSTISFFGQDQEAIIAIIDDPVGIKNQYRLFYSINGVQKEGSTIDEDVLYNGEIANIILGIEDSLNVGDSILVEMQCIDQSVFTYFQSFGNSNGGPNSSSAPANPYTNILGGALGYFNACSRSSLSFVVQ